MNIAREGFTIYRFIGKDQTNPCSRVDLQRRGDNEATANAYIGASSSGAQCGNEISIGFVS
ncbi:hypothetical protein AB8B02_18960 [Tardiphaga sp. 862_B3_N4_1]|uniref:hypothetical protein n=1 Tax=Tardiphaga sp. 862_B3_N4_1 TaxID=3240764 RepID=UPI003F29D6CE